MPNLTVDEERELQEALADPLHFLASFVDIPNKERIPVPFVPWPIQERLARNFHGRDIVVKDSQCGSTTIYSGLFLHDSIMVPHTTTVIMAHNEFTTQRLLRRVWVMFDSLPDFLKPRVDHKSANELRFPDINSVIYIATAKADVAGRGEPIHNLLLSECAFYGPEAKERIIIPSLQRVPPSGKVIMESTPQGEDEVFYPEVKKCLEGESAYRLHVVPWWENLENVAPYGFKFSPPSDQGHFDWAPEELALNDKALQYSGVELTEEQIRWRRWKIMEAGQLFFQEHLEDVDTCFLTMGEVYYNAMRVRELLDQCYPAQHTGPGNSDVWFPPEEGAFYVVGVDPGQGKVTESVASVWQIIPGEPLRHCARLATMDDPLTFDVPVRDLAVYYNNALINPEANGHGQGLIKGLRDYPNLYWRQNIASGKGSTSEIGWLTSQITKPFMMQQMGYQLNTLETKDAILVKQIAGWRKYSDIKAVSTGMTDHFMAACLAIVAAVNVTPSRKRGFVGNTGFTSWDG